MAAILADDNSNAFSGMENKNAIRISLKFVPMNPIVHNAALV